MLAAEEEEKQIEEERVQLRELARKLEDRRLEAARRREAAKEKM